MKKNPVNWFEIPVSDLDRAKKFYEKVFDCKLELMEMGAMQMLKFASDETSYGCAGTLVKGQGYKPSYEGSVVYFYVEDIDAALEKVVTNRGKVIMSRTSIGEYGYIAHFQDSEGNRIALHTMT